MILSNKRPVPLSVTGRQAPSGSEYPLRQRPADGRSTPPLAQSLQHGLCRAFGRRWVLPGDQIAIAYHMRFEICRLGVLAAVLLQDILEEKWDDFCQADRFFLGIGKSGDGLPAHQRCPIGGLGVSKDAGRMTHGRYRLPCRMHFFDQRDGVAVFRQIPQRPVTSRIEHRIVIIG